MVKAPEVEVESGIVNRSLSNGSRDSHHLRSLSLSRSVHDQSARHTSEGKNEKDLEEGEIKHKMRAEASIFRLAKLNKPEFPLFLVGAIAAAANGTTFPIFGLLLSNVIAAFYLPDRHQLRHEANFWSLMYLVLALGILVVSPTQYFSFGVIGQRLIRRLRRMTFEKVLRNEVGWFDDDQNTRSVTFPPSFLVFTK